MGRSWKDFCFMPVLSVALFSSHSLSLSHMSFKIQLVTLFRSSVLRVFLSEPELVCSLDKHKGNPTFTERNNWSPQNVQCLLAWITIWTILTSKSQHPWNKTDFIHVSKQSLCYMLSHGLFWKQRAWWKNR